MSDLVQSLFERIEILAGLSEESGRLTRMFCSPAMRRANEHAGRWMRQAGLTVRQDAIGNLIGRYPAGSARAKTFLLGSHLDTVRNAGRFDGALGVLLAIACVESLHRQGLRLPFALEVIGFADEEGARYQTSYLGSRAIAGTFVRADLRRVDGEGISMAEAIRRFGGQPAGLKRARFKPRRLLGYLEAHIEQGPILEERKLALGIVSAIAGQGRFTVLFEGKAGHAGTTPMSRRRDALCAAAEFVLAVEVVARRTAGLVATTGQIQAEPNASNVIPGRVTLSLDIRHQTDLLRRRAQAACFKLARRIGQTRRVRVALHTVQETAAVPCSAPLSELLRQAVRGRQAEAPVLASGAGHDAAVIARIAPVAMLFIRCRDGLSHHPDEAVSARDVRSALAAMNDFLRRLAAQVERGDPAPPAGGNA